MDKDAASFSQAMMIQRLGGGDIRNQRLTFRQASNMIEILQQKKLQGQITSLIKRERVPYKEVLAKAVQAADKAGDGWTTQNPSAPSATPGRPPIRIRLTELNSSFGKWIRARQHHVDFVMVAHQYRRRPELELLATCERAALEVLKTHGIEGVELTV